MKKLLKAIKGLEEMDDLEFIEDKLCQLVQLIKEADKDRSSSRLVFEYNLNKLNIKVIYDIKNYYEGVK